MSEVAELNGINVTRLLELRNACRQDPARARCNPALVAKWVGSTRSRVEFRNKVVHIGGSEDLNPMQTLLAALAACDADVVATHASILGLKIERLSVEAKGHFDMRAYLGLEAPGSGYEAISYTVRLSAPGASPQQIARLRECCERASPVADSLARRIPLKLEFDANT
jgi:uncharacterized OsmC-like protein